VGTPDPKEEGSRKEGRKEERKGGRKEGGKERREAHVVKGIAIEGIIEGKTSRSRVYRTKKSQSSELLTQSELFPYILSPINLRKRPSPKQAPDASSHQFDVVSLARSDVASCDTREAAPGLVLLFGEVLVDLRLLPDYGDGESLASALSLDLHDVPLKELKLLELLRGHSDRALVLRSRVNVASWESAKLNSGPH
jgi:hypothetical protein